LRLVLYALIEQTFLFTFSSRDEDAGGGPKAKFTQKLVTIFPDDGEVGRTKPKLTFRSIQNVFN